jgi:hypothetical protein
MTGVVVSSLQILFRVFLRASVRRIQTKCVYTYVSLGSSSNMR